MFTLYSHTQGGDKIAVLSGPDRAVLENELAKRKQWRDWWMQLHPHLPGAPWPSVIAEETIEEVPELV